MKPLLICETKEEKEFVNRIFEKMREDQSQGVPFGEYNNICDGITIREDENVDMIYTDKPIAYYLEDGADPSYTVWNFGTMEKHENVEGDIAGLVNLGLKDFPF